MAYDEEHGVGRTEQLADGVYVDIYDDGHVELDKQRLADRVEHKIDQKVNQWVGGCIFQVVTGIIVIGVLAGFGAYIWLNLDKMPQPSTSAVAGPSTDPATWTGAAPLVCQGNDRMQISDVTASLGGETAIVAKANCVLLLENCNISGAVGIDAGGNAEITMKGGSLTGSKAAVKAGANSSVALLGVKTSGARKSSGSASIQEKGRTN